MGKIGKGQKIFLTFTGKNNFPAYFVGLGLKFRIIVQENTLSSNF